MEEARAPGGASGAEQGRGQGSERPPRRLLRRVDRYQRRHGWLGFPLAVGRKYADDHAGYLGALVAHYAFFSLFPLLLLFVTILGFVLAGNAALQTRVIDSVLAQFPLVGDRIEIHALRGSGVALALGLAGSVWLGLAVIHAVQHGMNDLWDVPHKGRPNWFVTRLRGLAMLLVLGAASAVATGLAALGAAGGELGWALKTLSLGGTFTLNFAVFLIAFRYLTMASVSWRDVAPGALLAAAGWVVLQALGSFFARRALGNLSAFGLFAIVLGLLSWMHVGAQVAFAAAEVNVVRARRLWPRSLLPPLTQPDRAVLADKAEKEQRIHGESIAVGFSQESGRDPAEAHNA